MPGQDARIRAAAIDSAFTEGPGARAGQNPGEHAHPEDRPANMLAATSVDLTCKLTRPRSYSR